MKRLRMGDGVGRVVRVTRRGREMMVKVMVRIVKVL